MSSVTEHREQSVRRLTLAGDYLLLSVVGRARNLHQTITEAAEGFARARADRKRRLPKPIEGVTVDQSRLKPVNLGKSPLRNRQEVRGYRDAFKLIHDQQPKLGVSEKPSCNSASRVVAISIKSVPRVHEIPTATGTVVISILRLMLSDLRIVLCVAKSLLTVQALKHVDWSGMLSRPSGASRR